MKRTLTLIALLFIGIQPVFAQNGYDLYQRALQMERVEGDLHGAIALYRHIADEYRDDPDLVATALLQVARGYERLGRAEDARDVYERLVEEYPDETPAGVFASMKRPPVVEPTDESGIVVRRLWIAPEGHYIMLPGDVSPDGKHLVFTDYDTGRLAVRDMESGERIDFSGSYPELAQYAVFSPDGNRIAYTWNNTAEAGAVPEIRIINSRGGEPQTLYRNETLDYAHPVDWSSDGRFLVALLYMKDRTTRLARIDVDDGEAHTIKSFDWRAPQRVSISPNGEYLAYDFLPEENKPQRDIYVLALDGSEEYRITRHPKNDRAPVWSPDGTRILFFSERENDTSLWGIAIEDGRAASAPELIKRGMNHTSPRGFDAEGRFIYTVGTGTDAHYIAMMDWDNHRLASEPEMIPSYYVGGAPWSPDTTRMAYVYDETVFQDERRIVIRNLETGSERILLTDLSDLKARLYWMPDGSMLMAEGTDLNGRDGIFLIDANDGSSEAIVYERVGTFMRNPILSHDGRTIYFRRNFAQHPSRREIVAYTIGSGTERIIHRTDTAGKIGLFPDFHLSPDGRFLTFRIEKSPNSWPVMIASVGGDSVRMLINTIWYRLRAWTPDGEHLVLVKTIRPEDEPPPEHGWDAKSEVWFVSVEDGSVSKVDTQMDTIVNVAVHPDGERLIMGVFEDGAEVWAMENIFESSSGSD